jgi:hypothetical protein
MEELHQSESYPFDFVWDEKPAPMHRIEKKPINHRVGAMIKRLK